MAAREIAQLRLPIAVVGGEFVQEEKRRAGANLFKIQANAIRGCCVWHQKLPPALRVA